MHINLVKSSNLTTPSQPLTAAVIANAVAAYIANGGAIHVCPQHRKR